jgi:hypothetical protein
MVLRGMDRVLARTDPDSDRVFMRLNPNQLADVAPYEREQAALDRLTAELARMPQRQHWDRIFVVTPHYLGGERSGLASKLQGVGIYIQDLESNLAEYDVVEPDGRPGLKRRARYVALYYYATLWILDAQTLAVIDSQPWLLDEKIHDSNAGTLHVGDSLPADLLAGRIETFVEAASSKSLTRTLGGRVEPGELKVQPATGPAPSSR